MSWTVDAHPDFAREFLALPPAVQVELAAAQRLLAQFGPTLGRPWVDTLKGSRIANLKELRFAAGDGVWRVAFAFNRRRVAILLAAGDKKGRKEKRFYEDLIALAEKRAKEEEL